MDKMTRDALEASIKHWQENAAAETPDGVSVSGVDCALCNLFWDDICFGCPVKARTRAINCNNSPYEKARRAHINWHNGNGTREQFRAAAQAELDFLISLRPAEEDACGLKAAFDAVPPVGDIDELAARVDREVKAALKGEFPE